MHRGSCQKSRVEESMARSTTQSEQFRVTAATLRTAEIGRGMERNGIGVIGLGLMGTAIADRLLEHGFQVFVWNRTKDKADPLLARGAQWSDSPLIDCDRIIISLYTSEIVESVLERMLDELDAKQHIAKVRGKILIDTTTGAPEQSVAMYARVAALGAQYLDAPVSGSSEQTRRGEATVMVGGEREAFEANNDLWAVLGAHT